MPGLVAGHVVGTGRQLVLPVAGGVLRVVLLRVLLRDRGADRQRHRLRDGRPGRLVQLEDDRLVVGRLDAADLGGHRRVLLGGRLGLLEARERVEVDALIAVRHPRQEPALDRVLDVGRGHRPVDAGTAAERRAVPDPGLDLEGDASCCRKRSLARRRRGPGSGRPCRSAPSRTGPSAWPRSPCR